MFPRCLMLTRGLTEAQITFYLTYWERLLLPLYLLLQQISGAWDSQEGPQNCAQQPWNPTRGGLEGRLTVSSSSFPKRKLFLIFAAVETACINIISTSPTTSSFSLKKKKKVFHDQKPCPVCLELIDAERLRQGHCYI